MTDLEVGDHLVDFAKEMLESGRPALFAVLALVGQLQQAGGEEGMRPLLAVTQPLAEAWEVSLLACRGGVS